MLKIESESKKNAVQSSQKTRPGKKFNFQFLKIYSCSQRVNFDFG
jgi:hypothetical protein